MKYGLIVVALFFGNLGCSSFDWTKNPESHVIYNNLSAVGKADGVDSAANLACKAKGKEELAQVIRKQVGEFNKNFKKTSKLYSPFGEQKFLKAFISQELLASQAHAYKTDATVKAVFCLMVLSLDQLYGQLKTQGMMYLSGKLNKEEEITWQGAVAGVGQKMTKEHNGKANLKLIEGGVETYVKPPQE